MRFLARLLGVQRRLIDRRAREVAEQARVAGWCLVAERASGMRLAEARGYVRARLAPMIAAETDRALFSEPDAGEIRSAVIDAASDAVVTAILRELINLPGRLVVRRAA